MKLIKHGPQAAIPLFLVGLILALTIGGVYFNSLKNPFNFDDLFFIKDNLGLTSLSNFRYLFSRQQYFELFGERTYRPVTSAIYILLRHSCGDNVVYWRLFHLIIHLANCWLLYLILRRQTSEWLALLMALIFAVHTVNTEVFNIVSFDEDLLGGFFILVALYGYFQRGGAWLILSLLAYCLACFTKESFVVLPALLLLFAWWEKGKAAFQWRSFSLKQAAYWLILLIYFGVEFYGMSNPNPATRASYPGGTLVSALLTFTVAIFYYLKIFVLPISLSIIYYFPVYTTIFNWPAFLAVAAILLMVCFILYSLWQRRLFAVYLAWFLLFLLPTSNIIPYGAILAERYMYFPLIGLIAGILLWLKYVLEKFSLDWQRPLLVGGGCFLVWLGILTIQRNAVWQNKISIWEDINRKAPHSAGGRLNLGIAYLEAKRYDEAIVQLQKALEFDPGYPNPYSNLGRIDIELKRYPRAIENLKQALARQNRYFSKDNHYDDLLNLGTAYFRQKNYPAALEYWLKARELRPQYTDTYHNLALVYDKLGQPDAAKDARQTSERLSRQ